MATVNMTLTVREEQREWLKAISQEKGWSMATLVGMGIHLLQGVDVDGLGDLFKQLRDGVPVRVSVSPSPSSVTGSVEEAARKMREVGEKDQGRAREGKRKSG